MVHAPLGVPLCNFVSADVAKYHLRRGRGTKDAARADAPAGGIFGKESGCADIATGRRVSGAFMVTRTRITHGPSIEFTPMENENENGLRQIPAD
jgi:hypothetical protein